MFEEILELVFSPITKRLESLMASAKQLQQQITETKQSLQDAIARVEEDVEALRDKVESGIDPSDLDPISRGLSELKENLDALDPDPSNPATQEGGGDQEGSEGSGEPTADPNRASWGKPGKP